MLFLHQALTWGFLLALVPLLIHLINMMRHQRVQWAAMEFLLASYRKHRQWVWLKQMLLLLSRMAAVALIVAMLAHLTTHDRWLQLFAGRTTHHYVLLDDSYSMSERTAGASAFDVARQAVQRIVSQAAHADSPQRFTLIRFSKALPIDDQSDSRTLAEVADFNAAPVAEGLETKLQDRFRLIDTVELAAGPQPALQVVEQMLADSPDETAIVYLLSDFRRKDWDSPAEVKDQFRNLTAQKADVQLLQCNRPSEPNLGIVEITPANDTRAAGVPLFVNVKVQNFGTSAANRVQVKVRTTFYANDELPTATAEKLAGVTDDIVTLLIDNLAPGETAVRRAQVYFTKPGKHVVEAILPEDPVSADNRRWSVIDFPEGERVLLIDSAVDLKNAYFLDAAFRPLQRSSTGIQAESRSPAFLRDATPDALTEYSAIYLLDVPRLDERAVANLEEYVTRGGGLAIFLGPTTEADFYNRRLYRDGKGLLPLAIGPEVELPPDATEGAPDVELTNHPIFSFFLNQANSLVNGVTIEKYRRPAETWKLNTEGEQAVSVIAKLRDGRPLIAERSFGDGRCVCMTTTAAPEWNDWAKNPSYVVLILKMHAHLASPQRTDDPRLVGAPLDLSVEAARYQPEVSFVTPGPQHVERIVIGRALPMASSESGRTQVALGRATNAGARSGETDRSGVYEAWLQNTKGETEVRRWALNVLPEEGDLSVVDTTELLAKLEPVRVRFQRAEDFQQSDAASPGYNVSQWLMFALVGLLIGEQALAYSASYHIGRGGLR